MFPFELVHNSQMIILTDTQDKKDLPFINSGHELLILKQNINKKQNFQSRYTVGTVQWHVNWYQNIVTMSIVDRKKEGCLML